MALTPAVSTRCLPISAPAKTQPHPFLGYFLIAGAALCWALSAVLGKAVFTGRLIPGAAALPPLRPIVLAQMRVTLSLLVMAPALLLLRGKAALHIERPLLLKCLVLGILGLAGANFFYYFAIAKTTVSTAIIVQYTAPAWVLLYMLARGLEKPSAMRLMAVAAAIVGAALATGLFGEAKIEPNVLGIASALLAAASFSFYNIYGKHLLQDANQWLVMTFALFGASVFWLIVNPPWKVFAAHYSGWQWAFLAAFAALSMLLPFSLYFAGLHNLGPTRAIVTSCLEPVFAVAGAAIFVGETARPLQVMGIVIVLVATVLVQLPDKEQQAALMEP